VVGRRPRPVFASARAAPSKSYRSADLKLLDDTLSALRIELSEAVAARVPQGVICIISVRKPAVMYGHVNQGRR
jgi:hypothetical protein